MALMLGLLKVCLIELSWGGGEGEMERRVGNGHRGTVRWEE